MKFAAALIGVVMLPAAANADLRPRHPAPPHAPLGARARDHDAPNVRLWIDHDNVFRRGERARVFFRTDHRAHVLVMRIDTDGRLDVLFPEHPHAGGYVRGDYTYHVTGRGRDVFVVNDFPGLGYVFAIASWEPFDFRKLAYARRWDYRRIGYRIDRDPFVAIHDIAQRVLYHPDTPYSLDYAEYHVDGRRHYPRFLCYKCHAYRPYDVWNPYHYSCAQFRVVIYDDPHYYPYRYRRGSRVVYARTRRPEPRYEFKQTAVGVPVRPENFIERRRRADPYEGRRPRRAVGRVIVPDGDDRHDSGAARTHKERDAGVGRRQDSEYDRQPAPVKKAEPERATTRAEPQRPEDKRDEEPADRHSVEPRRDPDSRPAESRPSPRDVEPDRSTARRRPPDGG